MAKPSEPPSNPMPSNVIFPLSFIACGQTWNQPSLVPQRLNFKLHHATKNKTFIRESQEVSTLKPRFARLGKRRSVISSDDLGRCFDICLISKLPFTNSIPSMMDVVLNCIEWINVSEDKEREACLLF